MSRMIIAAAVAGGVLAALAVAMPGDLSRVSVTSAGGESPTGGVRGVTAGDGRFVLFASAENLTGTPTGGKVQVFVRDRLLARTLLVSADAAGVPAADDVLVGDTFNPALDLTPDGRFAVFATTAANLVPGDGNGVADVFRKDMQTGEVVRVSVSSAGAEANAGVGGDPAISADGARVVFVTGTATNLLPGADANGAAADVAVRDLAAGTTTLASSNSAGVQANNFSERPSISGDGNHVAFEAGPDTTNLYEGDVPSGSGGVNDVIVKDLTTGAAVPAAVVDGAPVTAVNVLGGGNPDLSGDGHYVVFQSGARLDPAGDANTANDVYRRDLRDGRTALASARDGLATAGDMGADTGRVSADGQRVAFRSAATNLVAGDGNAATDVFRRTLVSGDTARVSTTAAGGEVAQGAETAGISDDGRMVVFTGPGQYTPEAGADDDVFTREATPTDTTPPTLIGVALAPSGAALRVTGRVTPDPSGIGAVRVAGTTVRVAGDGGFAADVAPTPGGRTDVTVIVMDGAGNVASVTVTHGGPAPGARPGPGSPAPGEVPARPALRVSRATVTRTRVQVNVVAVTPGRFVAMLQRRTVVRGRVVRFVRVGRPRVLRVTAPRTLRLWFPRPKAGVYRVRVTASNAAGRRIVNRPVVVRRVAARPVPATPGGRRSDSERG